MTYAELPPEEQRRIVAAYGAGMAAGSGQPWRIADDDPQMIELIIAVSNVYWLSSTDQKTAPDAWSDDAPAWLRAHAERQALEVKETVQ